MAITRPTAEDLRGLAADNYFDLSDEELADFQALIPGLFRSYDLLEQMPMPPAPLKYRDRDPGYRPSREEDPYNAIVRRCTLRGASSGKLAGKRFGLKNNTCISGMPMDAYVADIDATIVTRLLDAGAEIVATLSVAFSGAGDTSSLGPVLNPHNLEHLAGGSSGGSAAALYYDDVDITIGADQGGSIRIPASWCGVVGLKPTHGLVPYTGIVAVDNTLDHVGPMSRTVADCALTLEVIAGKDPLDPRQGEVPVQPYTEALGQGVSGLSIGLVSEGFGLEVSEPDVDASVRKALGAFAELGARVTDISIPAHKDAGDVFWGIVVEGTSQMLRTNGMGYHWAGLYNPSLVETRGKSRRAQANDFPPQVKLILLIGTYVSDRYHGRLYARAQNLRRVVADSYDRALERVDVLAMPTTPMKAHRYEPDMGLQGLITHGWNMTGNTAPFDFTGHPAINVPCGKSDGLPVGLMLVASRFDEATLLRAAHAFEQHVNWETL